MENPEGYGRVIRKNGIPIEIKEEGDLKGDEKNIKEVNMGTYIFKREILKEFLPHIKRNQKSGEFYLTDI